MKLEDFNIVQTISESKARTITLATNRTSNDPCFITIYHLENLPQNIIDDLQSRVAAAAKLKHPNIQETYAYLQRGNDLYVFSEYLREQTLEDVLENSGALDTDQAFKLTQYLGNAVQFAHASGIVHGRLNNRIVRFSSRGVPKITGYDQTYAMDSLSNNRIEVEEEILYSSFFQAPEVIQEQPVTEQSDQYSLACIHYELLTGKTLFEAQSVQQVLGKKFMRIQGLEELGPALQLSLIHALQPEPLQRFSSVKEFLQDVSKAKLYYAQHKQDQSSYFGAAAGYQGRPDYRYEPPVQNVQAPVYKAGDTRADKQKKFIALLAGVALVFLGLVLFLLIQNKSRSNENDALVYRLRTQNALETQEASAFIAWEQTEASASEQAHNNTFATPRPTEADMFVTQAKTATQAVIPTVTNTITSSPVPAHANVKIVGNCNLSTYFDACLDNWRMGGGQLTTTFNSNSLDMRQLYVKVNGDRQECSQGSNLNRFVCTGSSQPFNLTLVVSVHENGTDRNLGSFNYIFYSSTPTPTPRPRDKYGN